MQSRDLKGKREERRGLEEDVFVGTVEEVSRRGRVMIVTQTWMRPLCLIYVQMTRPQSSPQGADWPSDGGVKSMLCFLL